MNSPRGKRPPASRLPSRHQTAFGREAPPGTPRHISCRSPSGRKRDHRRPPEPSRVRRRGHGRTTRFKASSYASAGSAPPPAGPSVATHGATGQEGTDDSRQSGLPMLMTAPSAITKRPVSSGLGLMTTTRDRPARRDGGSGRSRELSDHPELLPPNPGFLPGAPLLPPISRPPDLPWPDLLGSGNLSELAGFLGPGRHGAVRAGPLKNSPARPPAGLVSPPISRHNTSKYLIIILYVKKVPYSTHHCSHILLHAVSGVA